MCAATVSARRPGCSMPASAVSTSGGTFLLSFTYCSNCEITERASTSSSLLVVRVGVGLGGDIGGVVLAGVQALDARAVDALDQHLDGAVGQLQQLQDRGDRADAVQVIGLRIVDVGLLLRDQHDALVGLHRDVERLDGFLAADEQRDDHVRVDHHVAQRQDRHVLGWQDLGDQSWIHRSRGGPSTHRCRAMQRARLNLVKV